MNLELLREIRKRQGVTQGQMAEYLGYKSKSAYFNLETGLVKISIDTANKIAARLDMTVDEKLMVFMSD